MQSRVKGGCNVQRAIKEVGRKAGGREGGKEGRESASKSERERGIPYSVGGCHTYLEVEVGHGWQQLAGGDRGCGMGRGGIKGM